MGKSKSSRPKNCAVHSSTGAGRFGTGLGSSGILGNWALKKKREDAVLQWMQAAQGVYISGSRDEPAGNDMMVDSAGGLDFDDNHFDGNNI